MANSKWRRPETAFIEKYNFISLNEAWESYKEYWPLWLDYEFFQEEWYRYTKEKYNGSKKQNLEV